MTERVGELEARCKVQHGYLRRSAGTFP